MRHVDPPKPPECLRPAGSPGETLSAGAAERERAEKHYNDARAAGQKPDTFKFRAYSRNDVKAALRAAFGPVCAYCETRYATAQPMQVEHYRPKAGYRVAPGEPLSDFGYYWLGAEWTNLLPSCTRCNSGENHDHADRPRQVSGKANWFPLADEDKRAAQPGEEEAESPLLLHPYFDCPERHLVFGGEGVVRPTRNKSGAEDPHGRATIDVIGLNRSDLVDARNDLLVTVEAHLTKIAEYAEDSRRYPQDRSFEDRKQREIAQLRDLALPGREYSSTVRALVPAVLLDDDLPRPEEGGSGETVNR